MIRYHRWGQRSGFSLLELLIVLAIMVGVAALAFPRLTRPLAESDAHRAANHLRDAVTECRRSAALGGQPLFMRLESQRSQVEWGGWTELLAGEFDSVDQNWQPEPVSDSPTSDAVDGIDAPAPADQTALKSASLPAGVVIESVRWMSKSPASGVMAESGSSESARSVGTEALGARSAEAPLSAAAEPADAAVDDVIPEMAAVVEGERWYLPFLPSGRTRDCTIVLRDPLSGGRVGLELDSVTGMTRVTRLASDRP